MWWRSWVSRLDDFLQLGLVFIYQLGTLLVTTGRTNNNLCAVTNLNVLILAHPNKEDVELWSNNGQVTVLIEGGATDPPLHKFTNRQTRKKTSTCYLFFGITLSWHLDLMWEDPSFHLMEIRQITATGFRDFKWLPAGLLVWFSFNFDCPWV